MPRLTKRLRILTYHALACCSASAQLPVESSVSHTVGYSTFCGQLEVLNNEGWQVVSLDATNATDSTSGTERRIAITFDDGYFSDASAAECLKRFGFNATFFVPWAHVDRRGYLTGSAIRDLVDGGFRIGSHGLSHLPLTEYLGVQLEESLRDSKKHLEDLTGKAVTDLAVPFGRYNRRVIAAAIRVGYRRIATSDMGIAFEAGPMLPRLTIDATLSLEDFRALLSASPSALFLRRMSNGARRRLARIKAMILTARGYRCSEDFELGRSTQRGSTARKGEASTHQSY